jgi:DNA (cytosine-5)-methyltransferase 1
MALDSGLTKRRQAKQKVVNAVDLFCGAGGTSTGLIDAVNGLGYDIKLTAINHWDIAIATHTKNHEDVEHYCQSIDTINPIDIVPGGRLQLLVASPECTHHSRARGGKPRSDQKRADAWLLMRWIEKLYVENILVENVKEFVEWGPLTAKGKPDKRYKGTYFRMWLEALKINYNVEYRFLNCADYGDPTTRERFFLIARRGHKKIVWPERTHAARKELVKIAAQPNLFPDGKTLKPWVAARQIIDWDLEGKSIFGRKKPLSENTMKRIFAGLMKYSLKPFIFNGAHTQKPDPMMCRDIEGPVPTVTSQQRLGVVEAFQLNLKGTGRRDRHIDDPTFAQNTSNHQGVVEVEPFIVPFFGEREGQGPRTRDINEPAPTVTTNNRMGLCEPFVFNMAHTGNNDDTMCKEVGQPLQTVAGKGMFGLVEPLILGQQSQAAARPIGEPVPTIAAAGAIGLIDPVLINMKGRSVGRSIDDPTFSQTTKQHQFLAEAYLVKFYGNGGNAADIDDPLATVTAKDRFGLCIPSIGAVLDIRFRMLQPHELAAAMSFPKEYEFTGNREAKVKQIGNAVPLRTAAALCRSLLT